MKRWSKICPEEITCQNWPIILVNNNTPDLGTSVFNPMVSLPNSPVPPQQVGGQQPRMMMPQLPTVPQPQHVVMNQKPAASGSKAAPSNVVISVSDPIPLTAPVITAPMTVTVPPQHRLGGLSNEPRAVTTTPTTPQAGNKISMVGTPTQVIFSNYVLFQLR